MNIIPRDELDNQKTSWQLLKEILIQQIDQCIDQPFAKDVLVCINIHNQLKKVKATKQDLVDESTWQEWVQDRIKSYINEEYQIEQNHMINIKQKFEENFK